jgi:signal transduction histidine kinase
MGANNMLVDIELGDFDESAFKKHLESINAQVQFLSRTIDDFRDFFKPNREMNYEPIADIIEASLQMIYKSLENNGISIDKKLEFNPVISIFVGEMMQVMLAIINNAKDALMERAVKSPLIKIYTTENQNFPDFVEMHIVDNAGGIPEDIKQKIFEPYFTTKSAKNGTGLGLYIAKSIVEKHQNGFIGVENTIDGADFWIRLPLKSNTECNK